MAAGEPLWFAQEDLHQTGHALEFRIYAEDPALNWAPSPGLIQGYREPTGPWVRVDTFVYEGATVPVHYDPMIAKLIVWGADREQAIQRARNALLEYRVRGIRNTIPFFRRLLDDPQFLEGDLHTGYLTPEKMEELTAEDRDDEMALVAAAIGALERDHQARRPASSGQTPSRWKWSLR